ncbi:MAG: hypothetical protein EA377_03935 [Phycisphaerales bacterium]|nr:MAG: hypothetical protein EA377_03935 [Phycisphaerales bacterium]
MCNVPPAKSEKIVMQRFDWAGCARRLAVVGIVLALWPATAFGQADQTALRQLEQQLREIDTQLRLSIPADQPIAERMQLDYGGSIRFGFFAIDDRSGSTRILRQTDGILFAQLDLDGAHRFFGRLRFRYNDFNSGDSFDGRGDRFITPIGDRYWYQFDLRGLHRAQTGERLDHNFTVRVGRQFVTWGSGLTLSNEMYAALVDVEAFNFGLIGLAGVTPRSSTVDFDATRPDFDRNTKRRFFGGMLEYRGNPGFRPYTYGLVQRDRNNDERTFVTPIGSFPTEFEYDSEYYGLGVRGNLGPQMRYRAEVVHQRGRGLSNSFDPATGMAVEQTREPIRAWAGLLGLSWLARDVNDSRVDFEFVGGSGDRDRVRPGETFGGNQSGTTDRAFNSLGYVNTGLALAPDISNLLSLRLTFSTSPFQSARRDDWLRVGMSGFLFLKADREAPLNIRTTTDSRFVGSEIDLFMDWRVTSDVSLSVRYGVFLPGSAIPSDEDGARHFFYTGVTYAF